MKHKNSGFTLVELMLVVIVLTIIFSVTAPLILEMTKDSKINAYKDYAASYLDVVREKMLQSKLDRDSMPDGRYTIDSDGYLYLNGKTYKLSLEGKRPSGYIVIESGSIKEACIKFKDYSYQYSDVTKKVIYKSAIC